VGHYAAMPDAVKGPEGFKGMYSFFIQPAFPDQKITIEREVIDGDMIAVQVSWTATHKGPFLNIPATGKSIFVPGTGIFRIADGKIAETWMLEDFLGIYQQLTAS
jgi:predicted ester cyclase